MNAYSPPVTAKRGERQLRQDHVTILLALTEPDMDPKLFGVDILDFEREGLVQSKAHAVGAEKEGLVAMLAGRVDQGGHLRVTDDVGQGSYGLRAHDLRALPGLLERVSEEERQPGQVEPDGTPGVRIDQGEKVLVVLPVGNLVGASIAEKSSLITVDRGKRTTT